MSEDFDSFFLVPLERLRLVYSCWWVSVSLRPVRSTHREPTSKTVLLLSLEDNRSIKGLSNHFAFFYVFKIKQKLS